MTFATSHIPVVETLPMEQELGSREVQNFKEGRDHSIHDILTREYLVMSSVIPIGGEPGEQLYLLDPIELFLAQANVHDKIKGFAFLRTLLKVRFEFTVAPKTSLAICSSFLGLTDPSRCLVGSATFCRTYNTQNRWRSKMDFSKKFDSAQAAEYLGKSLALS